LRTGTWREALDGDATGASLPLADVRALLGYLLKASRDKITGARRGELAPIRPTSWRRPSFCPETLTLFGRKREFSPSLFV
jgi:hypothetical protein